jgi:predicted transcriptional regulator
VIVHVQQRFSFIQTQRTAEKRGWASSQKEAKELSRLMSQKLGQLGLDYMFSLDGRKVRRFPKFATVEISPDQYRFKIDSQRLPRDVSELDITKDEVIKGLECTIGKTVQYDLSEGGLWILVDRQSGIRNIPRFVDYSDTINKMSSKDGLLVIPLGLGANRAQIKIDFQHETTAHFLVGGTTGAGKTNTVHAMICTLIQRDPREVKLILVDLKQIEFTQYSGIPHLERPIVTEPSDVLPVVKEIWAEVQRRMALLREARGINHVREYNRLHRPSERLPYIVVVVDELAVIMLDRTLKHKAEIESYLARIASVGRASGIHLVLATQRPDKNVLTPLITANFPARIGLACASVYDSMTIIGNGDACFREAVPPGHAIISHGRHRTPFQVAYVKDSKRRKLIDDALSGKVCMIKTFHDVMMDELARYAMAYLGGIFNQHRLYDQFNSRGISRPQIVEIRDGYLCSELGLCPGSSKCGRSKFLIDEQPYCIREIGRGKIRPYYVVNCIDHFTSSNQERQNVLTPEIASVGTPDEYEVKDTGILLIGEGISVLNQSNSPSQPKKQNQVNDSIPVWEQNKRSRLEAIERALVFLLSNPNSKPRDLAINLNVSVPAARTYIYALKKSGRLCKNGHGWQSPQPVEEPSEESEDPDTEYEDFQRRANQLLEGQNVETTEEEHF